VRGAGEHVRQRMNLPDLLRIALRYTLSVGRGHLSVFMAGVSILGLVLATALLLTVLSVMNGFDREMRDRILALVPHGTVHGPASELGRDFSQRLETLPGLRRYEAFVSLEGMAVRGTRATPVTLLGLETLPAGVPEGSVPKAVLAGPGLILGDAVAERLGVGEGDALTLLVPGDEGFGSASVRAQRRRVGAVIDTGTELDEALVLTGLAEASRLAALDGGISGYRLTFDDPFTVDAQIPALRRILPPGAYATTWRMTHGNLYAAIQLSRDLVVLLLASIIGVAAFNVVSALVLIGIDQRGSIAILRTLGASPGAMAMLFILQGGVIGIIGSGVGCALGWLLCTILPDAVGYLERKLGYQFLNTDVYPVSFIPVDLRALDAGLIALVSILMCVLAAVYPALRAARLAPARVLQADHS